jgi:hypothetical protein
MIASTFEPPASVDRAAIEQTSASVLARPGIPFDEREEIFRIEALGLEWDLGVQLYRPKDERLAARDAEGRRIGIFLLHGGEGDFKSMEPMARLYAGRFGHTVVSMTYPGRLYLEDERRDWPGDTVNPDGSVRTPIWLRGERITRDQYEVISDTSMRLRYGTRIIARALPGSRFHERMAAWPIAFEEGMRQAMQRFLPPPEYAIYGSGHSTGGPLVFMICQRVPNFAGVLAAEHSPFGVIQRRQQDWSGSLGKIPGFDRVASTPAPRSDPFTDLYIRTWRDCARYAGAEALGREGPAALMRLPSLMEEVFAWWEAERARPQFKAEYLITHDIRGSLEEAARASAARLGLDAAATDGLVARYLGLTAPLAGPDAKPVPNVLFAIARDSRDHSPEVYREVIMPAFEEIDPAPRVALTRFDAGTHFYHRAEEGLPLGIGPAVAQLFDEAIRGGYFERG